MFIHLPQTRTKGSLVNSNLHAEAIPHPLHVPDSGLKSHFREVVEVEGVQTALPLLELDMILKTLEILNQWEHDLS